MVVNRAGGHARVGADLLQTNGIIAFDAELAPAGTQQRTDGGLGMAFAIAS